MGRVRSIAQVFDKLLVWHNLPITALGDDAYYVAIEKAIVLRTQLQDYA